MTEFTPLQSLAGGLLIGASAVMLMLFNGRIAGMTGMLTGFMAWPTRATLWRLAFIAGAVAAPLLLNFAIGYTAPLDVAATLPMLVVGGFLVGVGVTLSGGCTSGHGVCGLSRLSLRSIVAVPTFMISTALTVYVIRHVLGG